MSKSKEYVNFYENISEANSRLRDTVVLYDGEPYYVLCICDHRDDDIFRVYLDKLGEHRKMARATYQMPCISGEYYGDTKALGRAMDKFMEDNPKAPVVRKTMNSPKFNRFRPFLLGMCNEGGFAYFLERQPLRPAMQQGLSDAMLSVKRFNLLDDINLKPRARFYNYSDSVYDAIMGNYPSVEQSLDAVKDPSVENHSVAFNRNFAFARGPVNTVFLAYKTDIVGILPTRDFSNVVLGQEFGYVREVVEELGIFDLVLTNI